MKWLIFSKDPKITELQRLCVFGFNMEQLLKLMVGKATFFCQSFSVYHYGLVNPFKKQNMRFKGEIFCYCPVFLWDAPWTIDKNQES